MAVCQKRKEKCSFGEFGVRFPCLLKESGVGEIESQLATACTWCIAASSIRALAREEKDREAKEVKVEDGEPGPGDEGGGRGEGEDSRVDPEGLEEGGSYLGHRLGRSKIRGCSAPPPHAWLANRLPSSAREYSDAGGGAAFLPERSLDEKRSGMYRARLPRSSVGFWAWLEPASYHGLVLYTLVRDGTESIIYLPPYLPHAVYCPIDFADRRTLYHRPARESSHLLLYMLLLTSVREGWGRGGHAGGNPWDKLENTDG